MTDAEMNQQGSSTQPRKKPRLVLMGEFSAGKSTLSNIFLGGNPLPMRVTATRLPPVMISHGAPSAFAIGKDGSRTAISLEHLEDISLETTRNIELTMEADALVQCDLVDMPGISDPNMSHNFWEEVVGRNDHVIWCTHATQAWRQSEAAIWNILRPMTSGTNLLLITQYDKLHSERDKRRVMQRLKKETDGLFDAIYPVSLLAALQAGNNLAAWERSGAAAFFHHLVKILADAEPDAAEMCPAIEQVPDEDLQPAPMAFRPQSAEQDTGVGRAEIPDTAVDASPPLSALQTTLPKADGNVMPRRVRLNPNHVSGNRPQRRAVGGAGR